MLNRRIFSLLPFLPLTLNAQTMLTDDGLHRQPWFTDSFLDVAEDIETAAKNKKRLAILWELKGCPYCKELHVKNFSRADVSDFIKARFDIVQMNIIGSKEVTDIDGEKLTEKAFAAKYGVRFTPTIQFFPETTEGLKAKSPKEREVQRGQGYLKPEDFKALFAFVAEKAYEKGTLRDYLKKQS